MTFHAAIRPAVERELREAGALMGAGKAQEAFAHFERAHVLGQSSTAWHVRVHWQMFMWGWRQRRPGECLGQLFRLLGAAGLTAVGWVPHGNTGGANVSPFKRMEIPVDLAAEIAAAQAESE